MSQKIFKIYFKFFIKKTLVGEGFGWEPYSWILWTPR